MVTVPAKRELVRFARDKGMSERRALKRVGIQACCAMSAETMAMGNCASGSWRWRIGTGATAT